MLPRLGILLIAIFGCLLGIYVFFSQVAKTPPKTSRWEIESIDTMKFSRDLAREKGDDSAFEEDIHWQVSEIAKTGATHISLATPYDQEFVPYLRKWVNAARAEHLHVWFRGNMSGWEGWFEYPRISREQHTSMVRMFIQKNADLFQDGDVFSSCPECENGGPGDPRVTGDVTGFRKFLIDEYVMTDNEFRKQGKLILSNMNAMNYDVATLIMDKETTRALGSIIVVDHYVKTPEKTARDITRLASQSNGLIVLGEVGAPIPDIHGEMSDEAQNAWIDKLFLLLDKEPSLIGINYWTGNGASTEIWNADRTPHKAVSTIRRYYTSNHPTQ